MILSGALDVLTDSPEADEETPGHAARLGQYMTPGWAAEELVARHFSGVTSFCEPSCGRGAFLHAIPPSAAAVGVEVDPRLAAVARRVTGRTVLVGRFEEVDLPFAPDAIVGNPPFRHATVVSFLDRAWRVLPAEGRVGFILPYYVLQTASSVVKLARRWSIRQDLLPRNLFPRLQHPICFAIFGKERAGRLVNFSLFYEQDAIGRLRGRYRDLCARGEGSAWKAITQAALELLGGEATLQDIYREIEGCRPTNNPFWQAKVRQVCRQIAIRRGRGVWALKRHATALAA